MCSLPSVDPGLRPATEHRDYQIVARPADAWITVGGIRSTGLTASPGIAEYVADLRDRLAAGKDPRDELRNVERVENALHTMCACALRVMRSYSFGTDRHAVAGEI